MIAKSIKSLNISALIGAAFLAVLLIMGAQINTAQAANLDCLDIEGSGQPVSVGGVPNSGVITFDPIAGAPAESYEACLEHDEIVAHATDPNFGAPGSPYYQVKGWAWDTNLGWISFYCQSGWNEGATCGSAGIDYGVTIDEDGKFHGYAWSDNAGWISFDHSAAGHGQLQLEVDEPECHGYIYGVTRPKLACPSHGATVAEGALWTHIWADSVGWFNLDGVKFPWYQVVNELTVTATIDPVPGGLTKTGGTAPDADGNTAYTVRVEIENQDGDPVRNDGRFEVEIMPLWVEDTVKKDQTDDSISLAGDPCSANHSTLGAVSKPCALGDIPMGVPGVYEGTVDSIAPTTNMNKLLLAGDVEEFDYSTFYLPGDMVTLGAGLEPNNLILDGVEVSVLDTEFNGGAGFCAYGDDMATCSRAELDASGADTHELKFVPQTEITELNDPDPDDEGFINVDVGTVTNFDVDGYKAGSATVTLYAGIDDVGTVFRLAFDNGDGDAEWDVDVDPSKVINPSTIGSVAMAMMQDPEELGDWVVKGLYIYSEVSEPNGVKYFSNKLPRVTGATAVQPVAILRGTIYSPCSKTTVKGVDIIRSLGTITTNLLRDQVFKNVSSIIAGVDESGLGSEFTLGPDGTGGFKVIQGSTGAMKSLLNDDLGVPQVYYGKGDIHIGNPGDTVSWRGERTIITIGGNIYIDANIDPGVSTERPKLGIIALKDLSATNTDIQGNLYIHPEVSVIKANMYFDGSAFSYDDALGVNGVTGLPNFGSTQQYEQSVQKYQLMIEGSLASQNTVGGSTQDPMYDGLCKVTPDKLRARLYDFNYLRHYTGLLRRDADGYPLDINGDIIATEADLDLVNPNTDEPWSVYETNPGPGHLWPPNVIDGTYQSADPYSGDKIDEQLDLGATYIFFDPPSATLPGFGVTGAVDIIQRPQ
jgi:hypothetical protein